MQLYQNVQPFSFPSERIDLLLGVKFYTHIAVLHGWRFGTQSLSIILDTCFGWMLAGDTSHFAYHIMMSLAEFTQ